MEEWVRFAGKYAQYSIILFFLFSSLSLQHQSPSQQIVNAADFAIDPMVLHDLWQVGLADGTNGGQVIGSRGPASFSSRLTSSQANFHDLIGQ